MIDRLEMDARLSESSIRLSNVQGLFQAVGDFLEVINIDKEQPTALAIHVQSRIESMQKLLHIASDYVGAVEHELDAIADQL